MRCFCFLLFFFCLHKYSRWFICYLLQKVLGNLRHSKWLYSCMALTSKTYSSTMFTTCAVSTNIGKLSQNNRTLKYEINICMKRTYRNMLWFFFFLSMLVTFSYWELYFKAAWDTSINDTSIAVTPMIIEPMKLFNHVDYCRIL